MSADTDTRGLRILHLEDNQDDAQWVRQSIAAEKIDATVSLASTREDFQHLLEDREWDLVLSDFTLPSYDGRSALSLVRQRLPDLPFILVSGAIGEDLAVEMLVRGATDYVLKDKLSKLPTAIRRAVKNARETSRRRDAESRLRESEERFRLIMRATADAIYDEDLKTDLVWWNENFGTMFAYPPDLAGRTSEWWSRKIHPEDRDRVLSSLSQAVDREATRWQAEYRFLRGDGKIAHVLDRSTILYDDHARAQRRVGSMMDVTELRSLQQQFLQSQKMEAIGRLAGGMAHDFNNLLTVINGYCEVLLAQSPSPELEEILGAGRRAAGLTRQLLAFSRKQIFESVPLDLNALVSGLKTMLVPLLGEDVRLAFRPTADLKRVVADPGQIELAIVNLVVNARDAMPQGGKITIETANVELDETYTRRHAEARPGPHVLLAVSDTGTGMDAATLSRLFEPFFTTKQPGKGTGLGLSTVHGIVKQSGGTIEVYSEPGRGTVFKIYLPRAEPGTAVRPAPASAATSPIRGTETILVAEDVENIRKLAQVILQGAGYPVLLAADGAEALRICEQHPGSIQLLVTDLVMHSMNGRELAAFVRRSRPEIKVLYMSGYTDRGLEDLGLGEPGIAFLQKPFTVEGLARKVREVLDTRP